MSIENIKSLGSKVVNSIIHDAQIGFHRITRMDASSERFGDGSTRSQIRGRNIMILVSLTLAVAIGVLAMHQLGIGIHLMSMSSPGAWTGFALAGVFGAVSLFYFKEAVISMIARDKEVRKLTNENQLNISSTVLKTP